MICKVLEIRDRGTCIPVLAIQLGSEVEQERWLLTIAGYGRTTEDHAQYVLLCQINGGGGKCSTDPYECVRWGQNPRTYHIAHKYISDTFETLQHGQVVDVEYILGETVEPKVTDRYYRFRDENEEKQSAPNNE